MFRLWVKLIRENRMVRDTVICDDSDDTRTHKVLRALDSACREFDLTDPIWLDSIIRDFQQYARCRFGQDSFIEQIDFDHMEVQVLDES